MIIAGNSDGDFELSDKDIVARLQEIVGSLSRIKETNLFYDPLQYILMFPGWNISTKSSVSDVQQLQIQNHDDPVVLTALNGTRAKVSIMGYCSSRLMLRPNVVDNTIPKALNVGIHSFGKLFLSML